MRTLEAARGQVKLLRYLVQVQECRFEFYPGVQCHVGGSRAPQYVLQ